MRDRAARIGREEVWAKIPWSIAMAAERCTLLRRRERGSGEWAHVDWQWQVVNEEDEEGGGEVARERDLTGSDKTGSWSHAVIPAQC